MLYFFVIGKERKASMNGKRLMIIFLMVVLLDGVWFSMTWRPLYYPIYQRFHCKKTMTDMFIRYAPALLTWCLIAVGIDFFVIAPTLSRVMVTNPGQNIPKTPKNPNNPMIPTNIKKEYYHKIIGKAFFFGLVLYGVFNGTNYATLEHYPIGLVMVDTLWGITMTSVTSIIVFYLSVNSILV